MGFTFRRANLTIDVSDGFPSGTTYANRRLRSETFLKSCVNLLIGCNCGWELDTSKSTSITDFTEIPINNSNDTYPGLFMINSLSGCKLFLSYINDSTANGIKDFSGNGDLYSHSGPSYKYLSGLCTSMIPAGSSSTFGDPTTTTFIPSDATRISGTAFYSGGVYPTLYDLGSNYIDITGIFATPYCIAVARSKRGPSESWNIACPVYAVGKIFGALANNDDDVVNSKYGCIYFRQPTSGWPEGFYQVIKYTSTILGSSYYILGCSPSSYQACGCISKNDGTWLNGSDGSGNYVSMYVEGVEQISPYIYSASGGIRWLPIAVAAVSTTGSSSWKVSGANGFKGYLDTDLFRYGNANYLQTFSNNHFICTEGNLGAILSYTPDSDAYSF